tara:strand:- start:936 stop:1502 length:567 start_codon:yes stop_codon:yes gene_type:complete
MPLIPITPSPIASVTTTNLNASGDSSSCEFTDWHIHTQVINGMYQRRYVYEATPTLANGVVSGAPAVSYNYIDVNFSVQVAHEKEHASYCSGNAQNQQLKIFGDGAEGGYGQTGTFTTSAIGYLRRTWNTNNDKEALCNQSGNLILNKMPGEYNATLDTSSTTGSTVAELLMGCEELCPIFNQNLVEY